MNKKVAMRILIKATEQAAGGILLAAILHLLRMKGVV